MATQKSQPTEAEVNAFDEIDGMAWETITKPRVKLTFDTIGDRLVAVWTGFQEIVRPDTGEVMQYANFDSARLPLPVKGEDVALSASYQLRTDLEKIPHGTLVSLTFVSETPMRAGNPLKNYLVQAAR
jgi:hypothetical protein